MRKVFIYILGFVLICFIIPIIFANKPKFKAVVNEETQEIKVARTKNRDKSVEMRLEALEMRAEGKKNKEISEKTGFHTQYITVLVSRYKTNGLASITENHYHGNRRNLSFAEEEALLELFRRKQRLEKRYLCVTLRLHTGKL